MSGRIQSYRKVKHSPVNKLPGSQTNPHRARAVAAKKRSAAASAYKATQVAKRRAKKAAAKVSA